MAPTAVAASVVRATVPAGMLLDTSSLPLMYTSAPSSRTSDTFTDVNSAGLGTLKLMRKFWTILFTLVVVASSP